MTLEYRVFEPVEADFQLVWGCSYGVNQVVLWLVRVHYVLELQAAGQILNQYGWCHRLHLSLQSPCRACSQIHAVK